MDYTYSAARVRAKESALLGKEDIEQLLMCDGYKDALRFLHDKGYAGENPLRAAKSEMWNFLKEVSDEKLIYFLRLPNDYYNVKVSVKSSFSNINGRNLLTEYGNINENFVYESIAERNFSKLPQNLRKTAENATKILLQTQDGQLCDIETDKDMYCHAEIAAREIGGKFIVNYAEKMRDYADLRTAFRCAKTCKDYSFINRALCGGTLDVQKVALAAENGMDVFFEYISQTQFSEFIPYMKKSAAVFERECDNRIMALIDAAKYDNFSEAPIVAYSYAKRTEIDAVRLILSAKRNGLDDELIRERVRKLYV